MAAPVPVLFSEALNVSDKKKQVCASVALPPSTTFAPGGSVMRSFCVGLVFGGSCVRVPFLPRSQSLEITTPRHV